MTSKERKIAIKEIRSAKKMEYGPEIRKYTFKEILCGVLAGAGIAAYIAQKSTENIANIEALPLNGYVEEASIWIKNVFLPKLRNFPELWQAVKGNNVLEHFTAGLTALLAGTGLWQRHKKMKLKNEKAEETRKEISGLGR